MLRSPMAEAFSVASGAVGVIALGLSICQGLLAYYDPFKTFNEQISDIESRIRALEGILDVLRRVLDEGLAQFGPSTAQSTTVALSTICSCRDGLNRLQAILQRCTQTNGSKISTRLNRQVNRLLYPFRRETLMALMELLDWLQATLNISLQMLMISMITSNRSQLDLMARSFTSSASNISEILEVTNRLDLSSIGLANKLKLLARQLNQVELSIRGTPRLVMASLTTASTTRQGERNDTRNLIKCTCPYNTQPTSLPWEIPNAISSPACPVHKNEQSIVLFSKRWMINNRIFKFSVSASLIFRKGAQGLCISPNLQFRPIVLWNSPVFGLLRETKKRLRSPVAGIEIEHAQQKLLRLFMNREGAYLDTLPDGNTILHEITGWQIHSHLWDDNSWVIWRSLIKAMLQMGLSPNQTNSYGETPVDYMVSFFSNPCQQQATLNICSDLLNDGGYMTYRALDTRHWPNVYDPAYYMKRCDFRWNDTLWRDYSIPLLWSLRDIHGVQDINIPKELEPLIYRSRDLLLSLLRSGCDFQTWVASYTQWPPGLSLLLEYGYTPTKNCAVRACEADCEESLQLLISTGGFEIGCSVLEVAAKQHNPAITKLVVQALADHRRQLWDLADKYLPNEIKSRLDIRPGCLLDIEAYGVYQLLKEKIVDIDDLEMHSRWTVYDHIGANLELAALLWDTGFHGVDEENHDHMTPLMIMWSTTPPCSLDTFLSKANWFVTKGADVNRQKSGTSTTALHCLSYDLGRLLGSMESASRVASELHQLSAESADLIRKILVDELCDDCWCPCSWDGCNGLTRLLGGLFQIRSGRCMKDLVQILAILLEATMPLLEPIAQKRLYPRVLRYIACQELEVTHTCVHKVYGDRETCLENVYEIHDDEEHLLSELEQLLDETILPGTTPICPNSLTTWWIHTKNAVLARSAPSKEEISRVLEVGVCLER
ncbi:hypothetical protein BJY04DRAFT_178579 [Aspergillus karnatakaensis]|uniref:uncharacterized protein n=1 Tax=Aspergillus karnatakaensis TaxID=1810916 RepID=UPI003CCCADF4